jgi:EAL domain-containing protein (putative c-di-GMP-specific phosphodiesterase class I)
MGSLVEGIEEAAQVAILQSLGCRYGQGYYLCRPVPANQLLGAVRMRESGTRGGHSISEAACATVA